MSVTATGDHTGLQYSTIGRTYHSTDLLTARGVAHLVIHGTNGSSSYETIPPVQLETSGGVLYVDRGHGGAKTRRGVHSVTKVENLWCRLLPVLWMTSCLPLVGHTKAARVRHRFTVTCQ